MCQDCDRRFTTKERFEDEPRLVVVKNDNRRVPYRREKLQEGLEHACYKLEVTEEQIGAIVDKVEEDLVRHHDREVSSQQIGAYVGRHLRPVNAVAYVRFMSVYRKFGSVEEFIGAIRDVQEQRERDDPDQRPLFD